MRQRWAAAVLLVAGLLGVVEAGKLASGSIATPGPGFFPLCLAGGFSVVAGVLLVASFRERNVGPGAPLIVAGRRGQVVAAIVTLVVYAFVLEPLGFVLATFLLMVVLFRAVEPQRWLVALGGAALCAALSHVVFRMWLGVRLPRGPWGF
jgi:putative tricarboxylic transport membrane protein